MSTLGTKIVIDGDSTGFERASERVSKTMKGLTGKISSDLKSLAAGYVSVEAFKTLIVDVGKAALTIDDFSDRQNTTIEETQRLIQAFKMFGLEAGDAETALMKLASTRKSAAETDSEMLATFSKYGVSMDDLNNASITNFDLVKKIGVAMKDMKVNPAMMTDMKELFGKSGAKLIQGLKELGANKPITLMRDEDVEKFVTMERAMAKLGDTYNKLAAGPISKGANILGTALRVAFDPAERARINKNKLMFADYKQAHPEESETVDANDSAYRYAEAFGSDEEKKAAIMAQAHNSYMLHGRADTVKYFKDYADETEDNIQKTASPKQNKNNTNKKPLFVDQRPIKLAKEQADLDKVIHNALVGQLDPLDQNIAKRKEIFDLINESRELLYKNTDEGNHEAIRLQKEAVGIAAGLDSGNTPGIGAIPLDASAKANLGVGVQAYNPMIYNTQQNTSALKELTQAINNMREDASSFGPDTATVFE